MRLLLRARSSDSDDAVAEFDSSNTIYCLHVNQRTAFTRALLAPDSRAFQSYIRKQKVQKSKTKFKVALKDGIMSLNGIECAAAANHPPLFDACLTLQQNRYVFKQMDGTLLF